MKTKISALTIVSVFCLLRCAFGQGSLTPPGPPGATMLTLSQIAPRTPIGSAPCTITQPGSYYLTANLNVTEGDAIDIDTNGVTLDLNGFTISSTSTSFGTAILLTGDAAGGNTDITISHGHITGGVTYNPGSEIYSSGPGFVNGISYNGSGGIPYNVRVTGVSVSGCAEDGINLGTTNSTIVESCTVNTVGGRGIVVSSVSHSTANLCGDVAITADIASDCYSYSTGGDGIDAGNNAIVKDCTTSGNGADGINVGNNCLVKGCTTSSNGTDSVGINVGDNCNVEDCASVENRNDYGINTGNNCVVKNCIANGNINGIITGTACAINNCTAIGNGYAGIVPADDSTVKDCTASANVQDGIGVVDNCTVQDCHSSGNNFDGIDVYGFDCRIDGNTCSGNGGYGIWVQQDNAGNSVTRNSAPVNGTAYFDPPNNSDYGPVQIPRTATNPWANF